LASSIESLVYLKIMSIKELSGRLLVVEETDKRKLLLMEEERRAHQKLVALMATVEILAAITIRARIVVRVAMKNGPSGKNSNAGPIGWRMAAPRPACLHRRIKCWRYAQEAIIKWLL
jgi:hypothetical protein